MLERTWPIAIALGLMLTGTTGSTAAPRSSPLSECKLNFTAAKASLAKMKNLGVEDLSDEDGDWIVTKYDSTGLRPLGFKATTFEHQWWVDIDSESVSLVTTVDAPFSAVRDGMLARFGKKQCLQPFAAPMVTKCMVTTSDKAADKPGVWVRELRGKVQIDCDYRIAP